MRIALLTYEAFAGAEAVRRFAVDHADRLVLVGLSDVHRASEGDDATQVRRHLARSGWGIVPYLLANFTLPALSPSWLRRRAARAVEGRPLAGLCAELGVPTVAVDDVNGEAFRSRLIGSGAELIVTFHFDQILAAETVAAVPLGGVNVHAGLLPRHRGPTPTIHALLEDPPALGVTIHRLVPAIDAGPILAQRAMELPGASAVEAARRLHLAAGPMLSQVLSDLETGRAEERRVTPGLYCGWPTPADMRRLRKLGRSGARLRDMLRALSVPT